MRDSAGRIAATVNRMKPGEMLHVDAQEFMDAFPGGFFEGVRGLQGAIDRFLSSCIGSAYGSVRCEADILRPIVRISRHEEDGSADHSGFVYHVDPDRQWMFERVPGGWRRKPERRAEFLDEAALVPASGPGTNPTAKPTL